MSFDSISMKYLTFIALTVKKGKSLLKSKDISSKRKSSKRPNENLPFASK